MQTTKTVTIASGASLSGVVDLEDYRLTAIQMPSGWTTAGLSFAASASEGGTYDPVYGDDDTEVTVPAAASRVIGIDDAAGKLAALRYLKVRSGTNGSAVNQGADRTLTFILKD